MKLGITSSSLAVLPARRAAALAATLTPRISPLPPAQPDDVCPVSTRDADASGIRSAVQCDTAAIAACA